MQITRTSQYSGKVHTLDIDVTEEQLKVWEDGMAIQRAMPNVPAAMREFILSGITPEEWEQMNKEFD